MATVTHAQAESKHAQTNGTPAPSNVLQRACACGQHSVAGGACEACRTRGMAALPAGIPLHEPEADSLSHAADLRHGADFSRVRAHSTGGRIQPKLTISQPGDAHEREADRVADAVMRMPDASMPDDGLSLRPSTKPEVQVQRQADGEHGKDDDDEEVIRLKAAPSETPAVTPELAARLDAARGGGAPLHPGARGFFEPRFGHDFSQVRVHNDPEAGRLSQALHAEAFAHGSHIFFAPGRFQPQTPAGRQLLAHELTHVVQQGHGQPTGTQTKLAVGAADDVYEREAVAISEAVSSQKSTEIHSHTPVSIQKTTKQHIMRSIALDSTIKICHRVLFSRNITISQGGLRVVIFLNKLDTNVPDCHDHTFGVTLTKSIDWWPDDEIASCEAQTGGTRSFSFGSLSSGKYYLTIHRTFDHPYCCLEGDILAFDEPISRDSGSCKRDKDPSAMDIVHGALDIAGFIPVLGAIPDGVNAVIYVAEGDWVNAGVSVVAMIPAIGDGAKAAVMGGKAAVKVSEKAAVKLGEEGLAKAFKEAKATSKLEREAAEKAAAKADDEALEQTFKGGKDEGAYKTTERLKRGNLGEKLATDALAKKGHTVLSYKPSILGTNQGGIDMVTLKDGVVYFVDNKALTRSGNVSSVSALTTNFVKNKQAALTELKAALAKAVSKEEKDVLQSGIAAIEKGHYKKVVTNANITKDNAILSGVTQTLKDKGIEFIDVFKP